MTLQLRQPDRRSCGAASLVMARRLVHPRYARLVSDQETFAHEAATLHRRLTSLADTAGGWQVPWPRALGTPPWAVARELRLLRETVQLHGKDAAAELGWSASKVSRIETGRTGISDADLERLLELYRAPPEQGEATFLPTVE